MGWPHRAPCTTSLAFKGPHGQTRGQAWIPVGGSSQSPHFSELAARHWGPSVSPRYTSPLPGPDLRPVLRGRAPRSQAVPSEWGAGLVWASQGSREHAHHGPGRGSDPDVLASAPGTGLITIQFHKSRDSEAGDSGGSRHSTGDTALGWVCTVSITGSPTGGRCHSPTSCPGWSPLPCGH